MQILESVRCGVGATLLLFACSMVGCSKPAVVVDEAEFAKKVDSEERAQRQKDEAAMARQPAAATPAVPTAGSGVDEERARAGRGGAAGRRRRRADRPVPPPVAVREVLAAWGGDRGDGRL